MLRIDNNLLQEVGLGSLPDSEKNSLLRHIYETLEMRVGIRLADQMSNEQLDEFERYFEAKDDAGAFKWLETNFPNYKEIVQEEFDKLKSEVAQSAPQILSSSNANQQQPAAVPQGQPAAQPLVDPYSTPQQQQPSVPVPAPVAPVQPALSMQPTPQPNPIAPMPADINMSAQSPTPGGYNNYQAPPAGSMQAPQAPYPAPQPQQPQYPQDPSQQQSFNPPYPDQQPPAGPGRNPQF